MQKIKQDHNYNIGRSLKRMRLKANLSQETVAAKMQLMGCNTTRSIYSQMEVGSYSVKVMELAALKTIFRCSYEDFFNGIEITPDEE